MVRPRVWRGDGGSFAPTTSRHMATASFLSAIPIMDLSSRHASSILNPTTNIVRKKASNDVPYHVGRARHQEKKCFSRSTTTRCSSKSPSELAIDTTANFLQIYQDTLLDRISGIKIQNSIYTEF